MTSCAFKPLSFNNSVSTNFNYAVLFIVHQKVLGCYKWPESQESDFVYSKCISNSYGRQIPLAVILQGNKVFFLFFNLL